MLKKKLQVYVPEELARQAMSKAILEGKNITKIINELLNEYVNNNKPIEGEKQ